MDKVWIIRQDGAGFMYKADEVVDLARRVLTRKHGHKELCPVWDKGECDCGFNEYIADLEQILKEGK